MIKHWLSKHLIDYWYKPKTGELSKRLGLQALIAWLLHKRRQILIGQRQTLNVRRVPIIVVGNISLGGTGKTLCVLALARVLQQAHWRPAIVSRGYMAQCRDFPHRVRSEESSALVGDEPALLAAELNCPVFIAPKRVAAVTAALSQTDCNVIISDDGLQHYAMARDVEIIMIDGERDLGNECLLPFGPLREPAWRLEQADFVISKGASKRTPHSLVITPKNLQALNNRSHCLALDVFVGKRVHAVAGLANPQSFFAVLTALGYDIIPHALPDHHDFQLSDLEFTDDLPIIMSSKDAVKCRAWTLSNVWVLELVIGFPKAVQSALLQRLSAL